MTYSPNEPQDLPPPVVATTQMRTNFSTFQTIFSNNHFAINTSNQGKHAKVVFEQQSTDPEINSNYISLYSKSVINASSTQPQLFLKIPKFLPNNQENLPEQLTFDTVNNIGPDYQTFLPGGYIMYLGSVNSVPSPIVLTPACSKIASVVVLPNNLTVPSPATPRPLTVYATKTGANTFIINSGDTGLFPPGVRFNWVAIGIQ